MLLGLASFNFGRVSADLNAGIAAIGQRHPSGYLLQALVVGTLSADVTETINAVRRDLLQFPVRARRGRLRRRRRRRLVQGRTQSRHRRGRDHDAVGAGTGLSHPGRADGPVLAVRPAMTMSHPVQPSQEDSRDHVDHHTQAHAGRLGFTIPRGPGRDAGRLGRPGRDRAADALPRHARWQSPRDRHPRRRPERRRDGTERQDLRHEQRRPEIRRASRPALSRRAGRRLRGRQHPDRRSRDGQVRDAVRRVRRTQAVRPERPRLRPRGRVLVHRSRQDA